MLQDEPVCHLSSEVLGAGHQRHQLYKASQGSCMQKWPEALLKSYTLTNQRATPAKHFTRPPAAIDLWVQVAIGSQLNVGCLKGLDSLVNGVNKDISDRDAVGQGYAKGGDPGCKGLPAQGDQRDEMQEHLKAAWSGPICSTGMWYM